jgi:hypothetical protein
MTITKRDLKLIISFLLFLSGGLYGVFSVNFIQNDSALSTAFKWFIIPSVIVGAYYGYHSTLGYDKKTSLWRNILGLLALTLIFTLMFLKACQGYLILYNCSFGMQKTKLVKGQILALDYPRNKKLLNSYAIVIKIDENEETIKLDVPTNHYYVGQVFEKELTLGSLGFLYSY